MARFDRVVRVVAGQGGRLGARIEGLRVAFEISKNGSRNPNRSTVRIYNLAAASRAALERTDTRLVISAGYAEEGGPLEMFQGDVEFAWTRREGADLVTTLELGEGAKASRDTAVSLSYGRGVSAKAAIRDLAGRMGLALIMAEDAPDRTWDGGLSFHGPARTALDRVTRGSGMSWSIQGGALQIVAAGGTTARRVFDLAADSGLVGSPERERKGAQEAASRVEDQATGRSKRVASATQATDGWRVTSLLLPTLFPEDRVKLSAMAVQAVLKVAELRHVGDTHGQPWTTELLLVDPAPR